MKELLQAIQTQLRGDSNLSYVKNADIVIVPHEFFLPTTTGFPAIGLKDGPIRRIQDSDTGWEVLYTVYPIIYQQMTEGETAIVGQASPLIKSMLDIADDIHTALDENTLSISGMMSKMAYTTGEGEIDINPLFDEFPVLMKKIIYQYHKWEARP